MPPAKFCRQCGTPIAAGSHFCANCGGRLDGDPATPPGATPPGTGTLLMLAPWFVLAATLLLGLGYFIGARVSPGGTAASGPDAQADGAPIVAAPDISAMSPEERVDRLFNRVMALSAAGKQDSVQFFAPMAINALAALMPFDHHRRYDLGLIQLAAGDTSGARAQADTILRGDANHLLGLSLAMRAAAAEGRVAEARRYGAALLAANDRERAKRRPEYTEHAPDLAEALEEARRPR